MEKAFWKWCYYALFLVVPLALVLSPISAAKAGASEAAASHHEANSMPVTGKASGEGVSEAKGV